MDLSPFLTPAYRSVENWRPAPQKIRGDYRQFSNPWVFAPELRAQ